MIEHKGYTGVFEFDPEIESFFGRVVDLRDEITFYGKSLSELKREMGKSVNVYLSSCAKDGVEPDRPYSGRFNVRLDPALHREVALVAESSGRSMNDWVVEQLKHATFGTIERQYRKGTRASIATGTFKPKKAMKAKAKAKRKAKV